MREGNVPGVRAAVPFLGNAPYAPALVTSTARSSPMSARRACPRENNALRRPVPAVSRDRLDGGIPDAAVEGGHQAVAWATAMTTATPRRPVERMWVWGVGGGALFARVHMWPATHDKSGGWRVEGGGWRVPVAPGGTYHKYVSDVLSPKKKCYFERGGGDHNISLTFVT